MQQKNNAKDLYPKAFALSIFIFARSFVFIEENRIGFNVTDSDISFTVWNVFTLALLLLVSFLTAVVLFEVNNSCDKKAKYLCALIIADPAIFLIQNNGLKLIVVALILVLILNKLKNKTSAMNDVLLYLCLFVSAFLMPYTVFCFIPLILIISIVSEIDSFSENKKQFISIAFYITCTFGGLIWNKLILPKSVAFENFITSFSYNDYASVIKNNLIVLMVLPIAVFGVYFFFNYCKNAKKENEKKRAVFIIGIVMLSYALLIIGYILNGVKSLYTLNLIIPATILSMISAKDKIACTQINKMNTFIDNHMIFILMLYIAYNCGSVLIMKNIYYVNNIVSHII